MVARRPLVVAAGSVQELPADDALTCADLTATGNATLGDSEASDAHAINGATTLLANSASAALKITQTGTGNALVVEDAASDATPFAIDQSGFVLIGKTASAGSVASTTPLLQIENNAGSMSGVSIRTTSASASPPFLHFDKSRGGVVSNGDYLGRIYFNGDDGANLIRGAEISAIVDGTPGTNDMPTRLMFSTTAAGAGVQTERMRIDSAGRVGIGATSLTGYCMRIGKSITGATTSASLLVDGAADSTAATSATYFRSGLSTAANGGTPYTIGVCAHFFANQGTLHADSSVSNQYGFYAQSSLTGATNNYGFYGNLASASGRWNFYAAGTAPNYFAGDVRSNTSVTVATSPTNSDTSSTATASSLISGILTGTPTANINLTLPTGTNMDAAFQNLQNNQTLEWSYINLAAATYTATVLANTGHTLVGNMVVQPNTSARFATRKTAANTFITYRIA